MECFLEIVATAAGDTKRCVAAGFSSVAAWLILIRRVGTFEH
jgi:hypothetical protein